MASKTKEKTKAPPILYVTIDPSGEAQVQSADPQDAEGARNEDERTARYKFDGFVSIEFKAVVTDV